MTYYYQVRAKNLDNVFSSYVTAIDTHTKCNDPVSLEFTSVDETSISVQWQANDNSGSTIYELEASSVTNSAYGIVYLGSELSYTHNGLIPNVTYYYQVRARNLDNVYSGYASEIDTHTECNVPGNISFTSVDETQIDLSWGANSNSGSTVYEVVSSTDNADWQFETNTQSTSYSDTGLDLNTTYYYQVRARNLDGIYSNYSNPNSTPTLCNQPVAEAFSDIYVSSITANWNVNTNPDGTEYFCEISETNPFSAIDNSAWTTLDYHNFDSLSANTTYWFRVKARNHARRETNWVVLNSTITQIQSSTGIEFGVATSTSIQVSPDGTFANLTEGYSGVIVYETSLSTDSGWRKTTEYWNLTGLNPDTTYYFRAKSRNNYGVETDLTSIFEKSTKAEPPQAPTLISVSTTSLRVLINTGNNPYDTEYSIRFINSSASYVQDNYSLGGMEVFKSTTAWDVINVIGLTENTSYYISVNARNSSNENTGYGVGESTYTLLNPPTLSDLILVPNSINEISVSVSNPNNPLAENTGSEFECTAGAGGSNSGVLTGVYSYLDGGLSTNAEYTYRARYKNADEVWTDWTTTKSTYTKIESVTGTQFGVIKSTSIEVRVSGTFTNIASGNSGVNIYETSTSTDSGWYQSPSTYQLFKELTPNTTYTFNANSRNTAGLVNTPCVSISTCTLAKVPTGLVAVPYGSTNDSGKGYVELNWARNNNSLDTVYELYCITSLSVVYTGTDISFTHTDLDDMTTYYYKVRALNHGGLYTVYTSSVNAYTPDRTAPPSLSQPSVENKEAEDGTVTVSWIQSGESDVNGYKIYHATYSFTKITDSNVTYDPDSPVSDDGATSLDVDSLPGGTTRYFAVTAVDTTGNEHVDVNVSAGILPLDKMAPAQILNLTALAGTNSGEVNLYWTSPGDNGMSGIAYKYIIKYGSYTINESNFDAVVDYMERNVTLSGNKADSQVVGSLTPGKFYYFAIKTQDDAGNLSLVSNSTGTYAYASLLITSVETVDDDIDGQVDAYHIIFSADVDDSTLLQSDTEGFDVSGYDGEVFISTGLINHPDVEDDNDIYIRFDESGGADTGETPQLTYSASTGKLESMSGFALGTIDENDVTELDRAMPVILSAEASDGSGGLPGIQENDKVLLIFSENTNKPSINSTNIDQVLVLSGGHLWRDGSLHILSADWIAANILDVRLSVDVSEPTIDVGDVITVSNNVIKDLAGNNSSSSIMLSGDFGMDAAKPTVASRETIDSDIDGYIDAIKITFSESVKDSNIHIESFDIQGIDDETFSSDAFGDVANNKVIYITFSDGILTTDKTPTLTIQEGALTDLNGNPIEYSPATPSSDRAAPAILSAVASDESILVPGVDGDDTVVITFSEETIQPNITSSNIDEIFILSSSHTWGQIKSSVWSEKGDAVTIIFSTDTYSRSIAVGDDITINGVRIKDLSGNGTMDSVSLAGSFVGTDEVAPAILSTTPEDEEIGVLTDTVIKIKFSENMDVENTQNAIFLKEIRDKEGNTVDNNVSGVCVYDSLNYEFSFNLEGGLKKNYIYELRVLTDATDTIGNALSEERKCTFKTVIDHSSTNIIKDDSGSTKLVIAPDTLSSDFAIKIISGLRGDNEGYNSEVMNASIDRVNNNGDPFERVVLNTVRIINMYDTNGEIVEYDFNEFVYITIPYDDSDNDGIVDGTNPPLREDTLKLHYLDEEHYLWVRLPNSVVDTVNNTVTAPCRHFSVFALLGAQSTDLSDAFAFPVPYIPSRGDDKITFTNLSSMAEIKIFTISGELVKQIDHSNGDPQFEWDVKNEQGEDLFSGVYLYIIKNDEDIKKGKLMVIR
ncbi:MAG: fibronectin type III domain-containing protein [Endomicrobiales bacterium]|nr:fibronectin type III domain-containing protein [Endomicrobiales bacterium]